MDFIELLAEQAHRPRVAVTDELDRALADLDRWLADVAARLQVAYYGPGVGVEGPASVDTYRLVVGWHEWDRATRGWSLKICDGTAHGEWRPMWTIQAAGRRRKQAVVQALPALFAGYAAAVAEAGLAETDAGRQVQAVARTLAAPPAR